MRRPRITTLASTEEVDPAAYEVQDRGLVSFVVIYTSLASLYSHFSRMRSNRLCTACHSRFRSIEISRAHKPAGLLTTARPRGALPRCAVRMPRSTRPSGESL
jgi:hypothetical protein